MSKQHTCQFIAAYDIAFLSYIRLEFASLRISRYRVISLLTFDKIEGAFQTIFNFFWVFLVVL